MQYIDRYQACIEIKMFTYSLNDYLFHCDQLRKQQHKMMS